ncbi:carboxypeptidase regulatory-like domain-containing protein [Candidatus Latescibacterota bacterium]
MDFTEILSMLDNTGFHTISMLLSVLWQSSILLCIIGILSYVLRRRKATVRHTLWVCAVLVIPFLPIMTFSISNLGTPQKELAVLPVYTNPEIKADNIPYKPLIPQNNKLQVENADEFQSESLQFPVSQPDESGRQINIQQNMRTEFQPMHIVDYPWALALIGYLMGILLFSFWIIIGRLRIRSWILDGSPVMDHSIIEVFHRAGERLGINREFILIESGDVPAPLTCRIFRPVIILPSGFTEMMSNKEIEAVALHELSHVKRNDVIVFSMLSIIKALFFFHPLVWMANRKISHLSELACDTNVVEHTRESVVYADMLTRIAEHLPRHAFTTELAAGFILSKSAFYRRIEAVLYTRRNQIRKLSRLALVGVVVTGILSLFIALVLPLGYAREKGEMVEIKGEVIYKDKPVPGAIIYFNDQEMSVVEKVGKTDKTGTYTFKIVQSRLSGNERLRPTVIAYSSEHSLGWQQLFFTSAFGNVDIILNDPLSIEGTVRDTSGNPIRGAEVTAKKLWYLPFSVLNRISFDENDIPPLVSKTDKNGNFILNNLPPEYNGFITAQKKGFAIEGISNIKNSLGGKVTITLKLEGRIEGRVTYGNSGAPAKNLKVKSPPLMIEDTTDNNGFYSLTNLPEGYINIYVMSGEEDEGIVAIKENIPLKSGETFTDVDFTLGQGGIIIGRVIDEDTGKPVKNHRIGYYIYNRFINTTDPASCYTTTDETGSFRLRSVPGKASVVTTAPYGYEHEDSIKREVEVVEGKTDPINDYLFKKSQMLQGLVLTNEGSPVAEARIIITYERPGPIGTTRINILSDKNGIFNLRGFKNGEQLILRAIHPELKVRGINDIEFTHDAEANIICEPFETTSITGRVIDFDDNSVSGASIKLYNMGIGGVYTVWTLTDRNGVYTTDRLIIGDAYNISVRKKGYATPIFINPENNFTALKDMPPHKDLVLPRTDRILEGTVIDSEGSPVFGALIYEASDGMSGMPMTYTDADGYYLLEDLAEVVIRTISINHKDYGSYRFYDIPTNETYNFTLIKPLGSFTGKVVDSENKHIGGVQIYIESNIEKISGFRVHKSGFEYQPAITDTDKQGKFQFEHVIDETLTVKVWKNELGQKTFENVNTLNGEVTFVFDKPDEVQPSTFEFNEKGVVLLEGKKAPELKIDRWINKDPGDIANYKGKVVVLDFNKIYIMGAAGALRKLKAYSQEFSDDDVVLVGIYEHDTDAKELKKIIDDMEITCNIAIDKKSSNPESGGATFDTYGISNRYPTIVIDREGNVHLDIPAYELEVKIREYIKAGKG